MQNKFIYVVLLILIVLGGLFWSRFNSESEPIDIPESGEVTNQVPAPGEEGQNVPEMVVDEHDYSMVEVGKHNSRTDCWVAVNGGVYNLTTWIDQHPGGADKILALCGKDGSAAFNAQHGSSAQANATLISFKIGTLIQ
jgi:cytochrome b involved in lipid metabolism